MRTVSAWSCLAELHSPRESARVALRNHVDNAFRENRTQAPCKHARTASLEQPLAVAMITGIVVPFARARPGPVWPGLDTTGMIPGMPTDTTTSRG